MRDNEKMITTRSRDRAHAIEKNRDDPRWPRHRPTRSIARHWVRGVGARDQVPGVRSHNHTFPIFASTSRTGGHVAPAAVGIEPTTTYTVSRGNRSVSASRCLLAAMPSKLHPPRRCFGTGCAVIAERKLVARREIVGHARPGRKILPGESRLMGQRPANRV